MAGPKLKSPVKKISIYENLNGNLCVKRFGKQHPDLIFFGHNSLIKETLEKLLVHENDYENFKSFYGLDKDIPLSSWLLDVMSKDINREIAPLFENVLIKTQDR